MKLINKSTIFLMLVALSGCATLPTGPSVNVLPAQGKPFDLFQTEDMTCRQWAEQHLGMPVQETYEKNVATGAIAGTAVGAGLGAAIGSVSGHAGAGALIGAASGLLVGTATGSSSGQVYGREAQRRYDNSYVQCMYSYGNQVPGYRSRVVAAPPQPVYAASPPPPPTPPTDMAPPPPDDLNQVDTPTGDTPLSQLESKELGQYPAPQEVYVEYSPQFIYSPELNMYVAVGVPYDLVYTGTEYFYFFGGRWYRGPYYNGPWAFVPRRAYPQAFLRYRIGNIRHFRDVEFRRFNLDRVRYNGRFHRPEFRGNWRK